MTTALRYAGVAFLALVSTSVAAFAAERTEFRESFAPAEGYVTPAEKPFRDEICLNGSWQFQPVKVPDGFRNNKGNPPELTPPTSNGWDATPIKIPSPWNVNTWGTGRDAGPGTGHPYWPTSIYYPSYPVAWDAVQMGWLRRSFRVPASWTDRRIVLHFDAVAGDCQVLINGKPAGTHFDKYLPFDLDITTLVKHGGDNELLVGVRDHRLFDNQSPRYEHMHAPYPNGSNTDRLVGIWQDVFLLGLPAVRVGDSFVQPKVDADVLEVEVPLRNDSTRDRTVRVGGDVKPWINQAGSDVLSAPVPKSALGETVLSFPPQDVTVKAGQEAKLTLRETVRSRLKPWAPGAPNLYTAVLSVDADNQPIDRSAVRFGWRQFKIDGRDLLLNGQKIQVFGDLLHPFGPFVMSRRYVWAWYKMIQDMHGNAVRPHAQVYPHHYLDLADEMGIVVLDESAIFGSSIQLNFDDSLAWQRFDEHVDGLVLRDRNHASVVGWSVGNELFAIFNLNKVTPADADRWYAQITGLARRAAALDPTRPWISCDGDDDLRGTIPVWSHHFGHGTPLNQLPDINKPLMVGESGGSYYARPNQLAVFNGDRAYESYAGRNEALGIDVYDNIVHMAKPKLAYYSASETAWFGLEHLPLGYHDLSRLPTQDDGVFFTKPFQEGVPGVQIEHLPPYVCTLNPGWDASVPLYKPLAMFDAQKAALDPAGPWDHRAAPKAERSVVAHVAVEWPVTFVGDQSGPLARRLQKLGVTFVTEPAHGVTIVDATTAGKDAKAAMDRASAGEIVLVLLGGSDAIPPDIAPALPASITLTDRSATQLVAAVDELWTDGLTTPELYFAEDRNDRFIMRHGLDGPLVKSGRVLLRAAEMDWSQFNDAPEVAKCGAAVLYEQMHKPAGAALVAIKQGRGTLALCTLDAMLTTKHATALWAKLLTNIGIRLNPTGASQVEAFSNDVLINALAVGRFGGANVQQALTKDDFDVSQLHPKEGDKAGPLTWTAVNAPSKDRFVLRELKQTGPAGAFAVYFSYCVKSPRALDDLLAGGPDVPHFATSLYVADACKLYLNAAEVQPSRSEPADYRTLLTFDNLPLKKGWNQFIVKVASSQLMTDTPGTLAVRIRTDNAEFFKQLETAKQAE